MIKQSGQAGPPVAQYIPPGYDVLLGFLSADDRPCCLLEKDSGSNPSCPSSSVIFRNTALDLLVSEKATTALFEVWVQSLGSFASNTPSDSLATNPLSFAGRQWSTVSLGQDHSAIFCSQDNQDNHGETEYKGDEEQKEEEEQIEGARYKESSVLKNSLLEKERGEDTEPPLEDMLVDYLLFPHLVDDPFIKLFRDYDWDNTVLGPISSWHPLLRSAVISMLSSPEPRAIYWGNDLLLLYNDAAVPALAQVHPFSLGMPGIGLLGTEGHKALQETVRTGIKLGKARTSPDVMWILDRNGFPEETYMTIRILPITSEDGRWLGLTDEFTETTAAVFYQNRTDFLARAAEVTAPAETLADLWQRILTMFDAEEVKDFGYAMLYRTGDPGSLTTNLRAMTRAERAAKLHLQGSVGVPENNALERVPYIIAEQLKETEWREDIITLRSRTGTLPEELALVVPDLGTVRSACIIPVMDYKRHELAFVVLGLNPRRPFNSDTSLFMHSMRDLFSRRAAVIAADANSRTRLPDLYHNAPIGVFKFAAEGAPLYSNDAVLEVMGVDTELVQSVDELWVNDVWTRAILPEDLHLVRTAWQGLLKGNPTTWACRVQAHAKPPLHGHRWIECVGAPELEAGKVVSISGWMVDISHRKFAESLMAQQLQDAIETKEAAERFIDTFSHELRNPLSAILQLADGILSSTSQESHTFSADEKLAIIDAAKTIVLCAQHQKTIVDDILTLSKLDSNLVVLAPDICQVPPILQKGLKIFDSQLKSAQIESSIEIHDSFLDLGVDYIMLDSGRVLQIIINLLGNAVKFVSHSPIRRITLGLAASKTAPRGEQSGTTFLVPRKRSNTATVPSLDLPLRDDDQDIFIEFSVEDTGPGMTEDEMSNLFYRFAQASPKTYKKYGGSGLGLYISRQLTELHGGQIGLRSEPGSGSTFAFYIKAKRAVSPRSETEQDSANALALMNGLHLNDKKSIKELHILCKSVAPLFEQNRLTI